MLLFHRKALSLFLMCKPQIFNLLLHVLIFSVSPQYLSWFTNLGCKSSDLSEAWGTSSAFATENPIEAHVSSRDNDPQWLSSCFLELKGVTFRVFLQILEKQYGFTFFLDRRVNPDVEVNVSSNGDSCINVLDGITRSINLSFCVFDNGVIFIAPPFAVRYSILLYNLHSESISKNLKASSFTKAFSTPINFEIKQFQEYKETIGELSRVLKTKIDNLEKITFELSEGGRYKQVSPGLLLTLLLLGFDADYEIESQNNLIKPIKLDPFQNVVRNFSSEQLKDYEPKKYPNCHFESSDGLSVTSVRGPFNEVSELEYAIWRDSFWSEDNYDRVKRAQKTTSNRRTAKTKKALVTGEVANTTLKDLFAYLKTNADIVCSLDKGLQQSGVSLNTRVSCKFKNSDINNVSKIVASQIHATPKISENRITFYKDGQ